MCYQSLIVMFTMLLVILIIFVYVYERNNWETKYINMIYM